MTSYFRIGCSDLAKYGSLIQNNVQITANWSRSKPEVEFQYGGRLYLETGSSYISAANGGMLTKFYLLIDFNTLTEVLFITSIVRQMAASIMLYTATRQ